MEYLTEKNISEITTLIKAKGVEMEELLYDLVDHTCCMIEEKMEQGKNYSSALEESMSSFGNNGIRNIQEETTYLLTKNILVMRKTMHIIGITSALLLLFGSIFKIQHWPGAGLMYVLGGAMLCFLFMPLFLTVRIKEKAGKLNTWTNVLGVVSGIGLCFGILFKIMHWPFANILMNSGGIILVLIFLPLYIYNSYKNKQLKTGTIVPIIISIAGFSLMFSLVSLRNSHAVDSAIINIQYTMNSDLEQLRISNQNLMASVPDSVKNEKFKSIANLAEQIDSLSTYLIFNVAKNQHQEFSEEQLNQILASEYRTISDGKTNLNVLRKEDALPKLRALIASYLNTYKNVLGMEAVMDLNRDNMDLYLESDYPMFPLGIIIRDLSYLNLQVQKSHTSLLQYYKGKVS
jgi:hypothetical protein